MSRSYLYLLVVTAGFTTLGVELSASRLLDPWFGNSLIVWASLIGLILLYLTVGYWLGGRVADRWPSPLVLLRLTGAAAVGVGLIPAISRPVLRLASLGLDTFDAGVLAGSMGVILVLFAVPITLLGCVSPYAWSDWPSADVRGSGEVAGRISAALDPAASRAASCSVPWLIPAIGTRRTFAVLSLAPSWSWSFSAQLVQRRRLDVLALLAAAAVVVWLGCWRPMGPLKDAQGLVYETESAFNYIQMLPIWASSGKLRLNEGAGDPLRSIARRGAGRWHLGLLPACACAQPGAL